MRRPVERESAPQETMGSGGSTPLKSPSVNRPDAISKQRAHALRQKCPNRFHVVAFREQLQNCSLWAGPVGRCHQETYGLTVSPGVPDPVGRWTIGESPVQVTAVPHQGKIISSRSSRPELVRLLSKSRDGYDGHSPRGARNATVSEEPVDACKSNERRRNAGLARQSMARNDKATGIHALRFEEG